MVVDTEEKGRTGSKEVTGWQMRKAEEIAAVAEQWKETLILSPTAESVIHTLRRLICSNVCKMSQY